MLALSDCRFLAETDWSALQVNVVYLGLSPATTQAFGRQTKTPAKTAVCVMHTLYMRMFAQ